MLKNKLKDAPSNKDWLNRLIREEKEAIASYERAIAVCEDKRFLETYKHILKEEREHVEELQALKSKSLFSKDSLLQEYSYIRRQNENKYGKDFYQYVEKYLKIHPELLLSDLYYRESEWNNFMDWYKSNKKLKDSKGVKYIVIVNGERYASFDNEYDAYQCENGFYNMDSDAESYYGSFPDVRIIKEDANGNRIKDSNVKKVNYGRPSKYDYITYSVEGSEEGEIFDNLKYLTEARSKIRDLKKNDKELGIEQDYIIYKHYITEDSDYIEEV